MYALHVIRRLVKTYSSSEILPLGKTRIFFFYFFLNLCMSDIALLEIAEDVWCVCVGVWRGCVWVCFGECVLVRVGVCWCVFGSELVGLC